MKPTKSFKDLDKEIRTTYYNSDDNTVKDFLVPVLKVSKCYKRMTYSFSSAILSLINTALSDLINNECKIQYIVGFELESNDQDAIEEGIQDEMGFIEKQIELEFGTVENLINKLDQRSRDIYRYRLKVLSYLISKKILEIKVGFVCKHGKIRNPSKFKFHPKVMLFEDFYENKIAANGSTNESLGAHVRNEEAFDVFKNWVPGTEEYFNRHNQKFKEFWENSSDNIKTIEINTLVEQELLKKYKHNFNSKEEIIELEKKLNELFDSNIITKEIPIELRPYQKEIIDNWFKEGYKGIYALCTGAGKSITAIRTIKRLLDEKPGTITIIVAPYIALCEQWVRVLKSEEIVPLSAYRSKDLWFTSLKHKLLSFKMGNKDSISIITTNATYSSESFQELMKSYWKHCLVVIDECHHFGSVSFKESLNEDIPFRLGLSATPENEVSSEGNKVLYDFFKKNILPEYTLKDAIAQNYLNKYYYYPIINELEDKENKEFEELTLKILDAKKIGDLEKAESLSRERDELIDTTKTKIPNLSKLLDELDDLTHSLIYCSNNKQLEQVSRLLKDKGIKFGKITSDETAKERYDMIEQFEKGFIKLLLSIRILDEGIDIPAIKTAMILKSSARSRQAIQRRGRCLRLLKDKKGNIIDKTAKIYDFVTLPQSNIDVVKESYGLEIRRIMEFIDLSTNSKEAEKIIKDNFPYV